MSYSRTGGRAPDALRPLRITRGFTCHAEGSVLIEFGQTRVLCTASVEERVPPHKKGSGEGWVTAEYGMLPRATHTRSDREAARGKQSGRTQEIQRLIGRSLRAVFDLRAVFQHDAVGARHGAVVDHHVAGQDQAGAAVGPGLVQAQQRVGRRVIGIGHVFFHGGFGDAEALLGDVLAAEPALRERMVLATKGGILPPLPYDQSAEYLRTAIENSLRRLKTDVIDLWQIHRPDILAHPQETARVLDDAVASGKIRALGVSNFTTHQIAALNHFLGEKLATTQPEISPLRITCCNSANAED